MRNINLITINIKIKIMMRYNLIKVKLMKLGNPNQ